MTYLKTIFVTIMISILSMYKLEAKILIPIGTQKILHKVHDLPDSKDFLIEEGHYLDLATLHEEFTIAFIPIWITKEPKLVAYDLKDETYYEIDDKRMITLLKEQKLNRAELISLPFVNQYGGKLIILLAIGLLIYSCLPLLKKRRKKKKKPHMAK